MIHKNFTHSTLLEAFRYGRMGKYLSYLLVLAFLNTLGGCFYYKVVSSEDPFPEVIIAQQDEEKFIILHLEDQAWIFSNIGTSDDSITGSISPLKGHEYYKTTDPENANRYKVSKSPEKDEREVINEVHISISEYEAIEENEISFALENIEKIEIYDKASGETIASWVFSGLGIIVLIGGVLVGGFALLMWISGGGE